MQNATVKLRETEETFCETRQSMDWVTCNVKSKVLSVASPICDTGPSGALVLSIVNLFACREMGPAAFPLSLLAKAACPSLFLVIFIKFW